MEVLATLEVFLLVFFLEERDFFLLFGVFDDGVVELIQQLSFHLILLLKLSCHIPIV